MNWKSTAVAAPFQIHDPTLSESKIGTYRWSGFVFDVKNEASRFKEDFDRASERHGKIDQDFKKVAQLSFNAIHNVKRVKPVGVQGVPKVRRSKKKEEHEPTFQYCDLEFEFDKKEANRTRWPTRPCSAQRLLSPQRLRTVYDVRPKHRDLYVVSGEVIDDVETLRNVC